MKCLGDFTAPMRPEELDDEMSSSKEMGSFDIKEFVKSNTTGLLVAFVLALGLMAMKEKN